MHVLFTEAIDHHTQTSTQQVFQHDHHSVINSYTHLIQ